MTILLPAMTIIRNSRIAAGTEAEPRQLKTSTKKPPRLR
jgi:hypothetical protein